VSAHALSPTLATAERWAKQLGDKVEVIEGKKPDGTPVSVLKVTRGSLEVVVIDRGNGLVEIDCPQDLAKEAKDRLRALAPELQQATLLTFIDRLLRNPRAGYAFQPLGIKALHDVDRWVFTQVVKVSDDDPGSFQRFADALQEVVTGFMSAAMVIAAVMQRPPPGAASGSSTASPPPTGMYR